jgi:hypothetical protein
MAAPVSPSTSPAIDDVASAPPNHGTRSRAEVLIDEFCERGMDAPAAKGLADHVVLHHALARTLGVATLSRDISARGMEPEASREVATLLLAIELMDRGASYQTVVWHLKQQPISAGEALAGALDASRIHRIAKPEPVKEGAFFAYLAAGVTAVTVAMIMLTVLMNFAQ